MLLQVNIVVIAINKENIVGGNVKQNTYFLNVASIRFCDVDCVNINKNAIIKFIFSQSSFRQLIKHVNIHTTVGTLFKIYV